MDNSQQISISDSQSTFCPEFEYNQKAAKKKYRKTTCASNLQYEIRKFLNDYIKNKHMFSIKSLESAKEDILRILKEEPFMQKISLQAFKRKLLFIENAIKEYQNDSIKISNSTNRQSRNFQKTSNHTNSEIQSLQSLQQKPDMMTNTQTSIDNLFEIETPNNRDIELFDQFKAQNHVTESLKANDNDGVIGNTANRILGVVQVYNTAALEVLHETEIQNDNVEMLSGIEVDESNDVILEGFDIQNNGIEALDGVEIQNTLNEVLEDLDIQINEVENVDVLETQSQNETEIEKESETAKNITRLLDELEKQSYINCTQVENIVQVPAIAAEKDKMNTESAVTDRQNLIISNKTVLSENRTECSADHPIDLRSYNVTSKRLPIKKKLAIDCHLTPIDLSLKVHLNKEKSNNLKNTNNFEKCKNTQNLFTSNDSLTLASNNPKNIFENNNIQSHPAAHNSKETQHSIKTGLVRKISDYFSGESNLENNMNSLNTNFLLDFENNVVVNGVDQENFTLTDKTSNEFDNLWFENIATPKNIPPKKPPSKIYDLEQLIEKTVYNNNNAQSNFNYAHNHADDDNFYDLDLISNQSKVTTFTEILVENMIDDDQITIKRKHNKRTSSSTYEQQLRRYSKSKYIYKLTNENIANLAMSLHMNVDYLNSKIRSCLNNNNCRNDDYDDISVIAASQATQIRLHNKKSKKRHQNARVHARHHQHQHHITKYSDRKSIKTNVNNYDTKFCSQFTKH